MKIKYYTDYEYIVTSRYFDDKWYLSTYPDVKTEWEYDAATHYLCYGWKEGRNPSRKFDNNQYLKVMKKQGFDLMNPLLHYETIGKDLGFKPPLTEYELISNSTFFNSQWYRNKYLKNQKIDPVSHYISIGWKKGYNPSLRFDGNRYLEKNAGVKKANICPLIHYERNGKYEDRVIFPCVNPKYTKKNLFWKSLQKIILNVFRIINYKIRSEKILVCLHLFYPDSWDEIKCYLDNLSIYNYDLVVTYPNEVMTENLKNEIINYKSSVNLFEYDNRGYDVGPFIDALKNVKLDDYSYVFKIHSKGISRPRLIMYGKVFKNKEWFEKLFRGVLGIVNTHITLQKLHKGSGMVASKQLIVKDPAHKINLTKEYCNQLGYKFNENYLFVAGTCFAIQSQLLNEILDLNLSIKDFDYSVRGEYSLAHGLERIICMSVLNQGFSICGNNTFNLIDIPRKIQARSYRRYSSLCLLDDSRFVIDNNCFYRLFENRQIEKYEVVDIKINDIYRIWNDKKIKLKDCAPYKYLLGYREEYYKYCMIHENSDLPLMSKERYDNLIDSIEKNGFDDKYIIIVNQDNVIQDGQHRACYYAYKNGLDSTVRVLRIFFRGHC